MQQQEKKAEPAFGSGADKYQEDFRAYLRHRRYSDSTVKTYGN
jgi:hypothetical protein